MISLCYYLLILEGLTFLLLTHHVTSGSHIIILLLHNYLIVRNRNIMAIVETVWIRIRLLVRSSIIYFVLGMLKNIRACQNLRLSWDSFRIWVFAVGAHVHIGVIVLLLQGWPSLLPNQRCIIFVLWSILLKEGLSGRTLRLTMVTYISANVLTLVKAAVVNALLHAFGTDNVSWALIRVVEDVGICYVLSVYTSSTLDQRKGLVSTDGIQILVWVRCKSSTSWLFLVLFIVAASGQIRQFFVRLTELFIILLLVWVNSLDLIGGANFNLSSVASHIIRVFAVLTKRVCKSGSNAWLSQGPSVLLLQHVFLLPQLLEPVVFKGLARSNSVIWIVN